MALFCLAILIGNGYTTYREIQKAPSREESFERKARLALEVPGMSREELKDRGEELETEFEYRKRTGQDTERVPDTGKRTS